MSTKFSLPPKVEAVLGPVLFLLASLWVAPRAYSMLTTAWHSQHPSYLKVLFFGFIFAGFYMVISMMVFGSKSKNLKLDSMWDFLMGPKPTEAQKRNAWSWGRQAIYAVLAGFLCWLLILFIEVGKWLIGTGH